MRNKIAHWRWYGIVYFCLSWLLILIQRRRQQMLFRTQNLRPNSLSDCEFKATKITTTICVIVCCFVVAPKDVYFCAYVYSVPEPQPERTWINAVMIMWQQIGMILISSASCLLPLCPDDDDTIICEMRAINPKLAVLGFIFTFDYCYKELTGAPGSNSKSCCLRFLGNSYGG